MARKIKLKNVDIVVTKGANSIPFNYLDILQTILKQQPQGGFDYETMSKSMKISDKLEAMEGGVEQYLTLEDADWEYLNTKVGAFRWGYAHNEILAFRNAIKDAETVEI